MAIMEHWKHWIALRPWRIEGALDIRFQDVVCHDVVRHVVVCNMMFNASKEGACELLKYETVGKSELDPRLDRNVAYIMSL